MGEEEAEEAPTEGTVDGTQERKVVALKTKPKAKAKPKKKDVVSPGVGENVVKEEARDDEGDKVRPRRRFKKVISIPVPETRDSEETESEKDVRKITADLDVNKEEQTKKRRQKQSARIGPAAKWAKIGLAQVRELLMEDDELILELEKMKINPKVKYEKEPIPSIEGEPTI
ncbi:hypothetical protein Dimus_031704 [Dionaea muscipula]